MNAQTEMRLPALVGGGSVMAIVPQTFEETFRIARAVVSAGLAPSALIGKKTGDDAASAVTVAIMSGAELGLKPMVALRSFTVINGKPALYGDGLINVVRMSGKVTYLRTGCETRNGKMIGFCEAKRSDTGEEKRVEFSQDDAIRAGLWQSEALVRKQVWENNQRVWRDNQPNDSPWYRFPQRMLAWRAAGYCLRELFGDVLGGIRDEFEAREIAEAEEMRDVTPTAPAIPAVPAIPKIPSPSAVDSEQVDPGEIVIETGESTETLMDGMPFDLEKFLVEIDEAMGTGKTEDEITEIWDGFDVEAVLTEDEDALQRAFDLRKKQIARVLRAYLASHPMNAG